MTMVTLPIVILAYIAVVVTGIWLLFKLLSGIGWVLGRGFQGVGHILGRIFTFIRDEVSDALRIVGGTITALFFTPLILANVIVGRWSAVTHYGRAIEEELIGVAGSAYRVVCGNLCRLFGLTGLTDGIEHRIPQAMARVPGRDTPDRRTGHFDGYRVVGSLPAGGSGAHLWLAEPSDAKRDQFLAANLPSPGKVVIKSFALADGSTLPQIVRENRALQAARKLGLVLEHELTPQRFHYVMPYVPGNDLGVISRRMHDKSGPRGLDDQELRSSVGYARDLLRILHHFHTNDLWHKDVKPSNIIVSSDGVHLVDLGLLTPLSSAMTLTTHGTEYFRDPELVRLAMRGVKVHEVDGVKFDIYSAGAVLFSMLENSFPAHGSLSQITRRCPEALRWIVRRAMADMGNRYGSAAEMLADLEAVQEARQPFALKPAALPSVRGDKSLVAALSATTPSQYGPVFAASASAHVPHVTPPYERARSPLVARLALGLLTVMGVTALTGGGLFLFMNAGSRPQLQPASSSMARFDRTAGIPKMLPDGTIIVTKPQRSSLVTTRPVMQRASTAAPSVAPPPLPAGKGRPVLIVNDLPVSVDDSVREQALMLGAMLRQAGFVVMDAKQVDDTDAVISLLAGARAAAGLADPADSEAGQRLLNWVESQGSALDAVLWIGAAPRGSRYTCRIVAPDPDLSQDLSRIVDLAEGR